MYNLNLRAKKPVIGWNNRIIVRPLKIIYTGINKDISSFTTTDISLACKKMYNSFQYKYYK